MEVFTGDSRLPTDVVLFPDTHLTPFDLPRSDHHRTATDHHQLPVFNDHHFLLPPPQPPQKLRPIRCNGRNLPEFSPSDDTKPLGWQSELGFYNSEIDTGCFIPPKTSAVSLSSNECPTEAALSSSSDEGSKLEEPTVNRKKRKRRTRKKLELFVEGMMRTVMEKQEEMHRQLIQILDNKEKERITREEAWKQQEIERAKRDEHNRAQEVSRNLALISFIQNSLGHDIKIPKPLDTSNIDKHDNLKFDPVGNHEELKCDTSSTIEESECDLNNKRWPKSEVQALITVRAALYHKSKGKGAKGSVWEEVAAGLSGLGYNRTPRKCKEKWENINKYYRRTMDKAVKSKECSYFSELEMLYKAGFMTSGDSHDEDQSMRGLHPDSNKST